MLMSATSSEDVDRLTKLVLHNPLTLNLLGAATSGEQVREPVCIGHALLLPKPNAAAWLGCRLLATLQPTLHPSQAGAAAAAAAGGAAAEIEHFRIDMPAGCASGGPAAETAEKLLHLLALLKLNLVQRKVSGSRQGTLPSAVPRAGMLAAPVGRCVQLVTTASVADCSAGDREQLWARVVVAANLQFHQSIADRRCWCL